MVVQRYDDLLALGQCVDRLGEQVLGLLGLEGLDGVLGLGVLKGELVALLAAGGEELIEGDDVDDADLAEQLPGDLRLGRRAMQPSLERRIGLRDFARLVTDQAGNQSIERSSSIMTPLIRLMA